MIKRYIPLLFVLSTLCFSLPAQAQLSSGIIGGFSMGSVKVKDLDAAFERAIEGQNIYGYEAGIFIKLKISPIYIRPMALYAFRSGDVTYRTTSDGNQTATFSTHKIEIPVMVGFNIIGPLNIEAGPVYHYLLSVTEHYSSADVSLGRSGLGYRAGAVAELGPLLLGLNYQGALYGSGNNARIEEPYKIVASLGFRLGKSGDD
jgi:hypothetical protein